MKQRGTGALSWQRARVLVLSEHPITRAGIRACLKECKDLAFAAELTEAKQAREAVAQIKPDLLLIDLSPPTSLCLTMIDDLHRFFPDLPVLVLSTQDERLFAERVLRVGAMGYVMEQTGCDNILHAMRDIIAGQIYVSPALSQVVLRRATGGRSQASLTPIDVLTQREFDIFQMMGQGKSTHEISTRLHVSPKTIAVHRNHIRRKLKLRANSDLLETAISFCQRSETDSLSKQKDELLAENEALRLREQKLMSEVAALRRQPRKSVAVRSTTL